MHNLKGQRALVTGGNTGIGKSIVRCLAAGGARVVIDYVAEPQAAQLLADEINRHYGPNTALALEADISDEASVERLLASAITFLGGLDILVNNAGIEAMYAALDLPMTEWDRVLGVNLRGAFMCARAAARQMVRQRSGGVVINISSMHDRVPRLGATPYNVSKAGLTMLTKVLALEWAEYGIRVVGVAPGAIDVGKLKGLTSLVVRRLIKGWVPLRRMGTVDEVGKAVAFLASNEAAYITGETLTIDGAYSLNVVRYDDRKMHRSS